MRAEHCHRRVSLQAADAQDQGIGPQLYIGIENQVILAEGAGQRPIVTGAETEIFR